MLNIKQYFGEGGMNSDHAPKLLPEFDYLTSYNVRSGSSDDNKKGAVESIRGTSLVNYSLPAGNNQVVGSYEDREDNAIYYFLYNSNSNHNILRFNGSDSTVDQILESSILDLTSTALITSITKIGNLLLWVDRNGKQRELAVDRAILNHYDTAEDVAISLYKPAPSGQISLTVLESAPSGSTIDENLVYNKNFQFASRYLYKDGEYSLLGPITEVRYACRNTSPLTSYERGYALSQTVNQNERKSVDKVQFLYREGSTANWRLFHTSDTVFDEVAVSSIAPSVSFYGKHSSVAVSQDETNRVFESIPKTSDSIASFKNRVFANEKTTDFDIDSWINNVSLTLTKTAGTNLTDGSNRYRHFKQGTTKPFGLICEDIYGRRTGVLKTQEVDFDFYIDGETLPVYGGSELWPKAENLKSLNYSVSGSFPSWVDSVYIASPKSYTDYCQVPVNIFFYIQEDDTAGSPPAGRFVRDGKQFLDQKPTAETDYEKIYLQLPLSTPIEITEDYVVRFCAEFESGTRNQDVYSIESVEGDFIVLNQLFSDTPTWSSNHHVRVAEFYKHTNPGDIFYEIEKVSLQGYSGSVTGAIPGDTFREYSINGATAAFGGEYTKVWMFNNNSTNVPSGYTVADEMHMAYRIESPVRALSSEKSRFYATEDEMVISDHFSGYDYTKADWHYGHPNLEIENEQEFENPHIIRYSEEKVPDSNYNGLSNFPAANKFVIPRERGRVVKLVPADDVLLAIHPHAATSLYFGQDTLTTTDSNSIVVQGTNVINRERVLQGDYGTEFPESIAHNDGRVYWFDFDEAEPIRYSNNGLTPLGTLYNYKDWFRDKVAALTPYKSTIKIHGGYDPLHEEYHLAFPSPTGSIPAEVVVFSERKRKFVGVYQYSLEGYSKIGSKMVSFHGGALYLHNSGSTYNKWGTASAVNSKFRYEVNVNPSQVKEFQNIAIECSHKPYKVTISNEDGQSTELGTADLHLKNGVYYGMILRDQNTPYVTYPLFNGDRMVSQTVTVEIEFSETTELVTIYFVNMGYIPVSGHRKL
jgi:hypothetical protein